VASFHKKQKPPFGSLFLFSNYLLPLLLHHSLHLHSPIRCLQLHGYSPWSHTQVVGADGVVTELVSITVGGEQLAGDENAYVKCQADHLKTVHGAELN
jgi:hypothetical protein